MKKLLLIFLASLFVALTSCTNPEAAQPLARVHDKYLYPSEIDRSMFNNISDEDSVLIMKSYIDKWVQNQLLLRLAENNLSDAEKNVSRELENYRASLLIFKFEQAFVSQKMDTLFSVVDLQEYYERNKEYFILEEPIVKALYIKLRKNAPQIDRIKKLYKSTDDEDVKNLDNLAYQVAVKYDYFGDRWVPLELIAQQLPEGSESTIMNISVNFGVEFEDDEHIYLVYFKDVMKRGEIMPFEYSMEQIKDIMYNIRRNNLIRDLERNLISREKDNGEVQIFVN